MNREQNSKIVTMEAHLLQVHPYAQRKVNQAKLIAMREKFDLDAIGVLHAVEYEIDGKRGTWIVDGQHRHKNLLALGFGEWPVEVMIHTDVTSHDRAAELFLELNFRASVSCFATFKNQVTAGIAPAVHVTRLVEACGLKIAPGTGDGVVRCVGALQAAYAYDSGVSLMQALQTILAAWGNGAAGLDGNVVEGITKVYRTFPGDVNQAALVKRLAQFPGGASGILGAAKGRRAYRKGVTLPACVAEVVVDAYNVKRTTRRLGRHESQNAKAEGALDGRS